MDITPSRRVCCFPTEFDTQCNFIRVCLPLSLQLSELCKNAISKATGDQGDGSLGMMLILQTSTSVQGPESMLEKRPGVDDMFVIPEPGRCRQKDPWGSLVSSLV